MYFLYSILLLLSFFVYIPIYFVKLRVLRGESLCLRERLGFHLPEKLEKCPSLWLHAVSVGEVLSLQNLIKKIKEKHPDWVIYFSTLTITGMQIAKKKLHGVDRFFFIPMDFNVIVKRFFKQLNPNLFILAESEFWPNLLRQAKKNNCPVILINGRISPSSFNRYRRIKFLVKVILKNIDYFLVQTKEDRMRLEKIGVDPQVIEVAGNLKSDVNLPLLSKDQLLQIKKSLNIPENERIFIAGSTRKGEEEILLQSFKKAKSKENNLLLIIAPRHPERTPDIEKLCQNFNLKVAKRTEEKHEKHWDVLILDTLGELANFYALCDIAFIGGSLVPWGGQNLLEPAFYEKPIFFGPHMENFSYLARKFIQTGAAKVVNNEKELCHVFLNKNKVQLKQMGSQAKKTLNSLQGPTERTLAFIENMVNKNP